MASSGPVDLEELIEAVRPLTGRIGEIGAETRLLSSGAVDSLSFAELADTLSSKFGVSLGYDHIGYDNADTPAQLLALVNERRSRS